MTKVDDAEIPEIGRTLRHALVAALTDNKALRSPRWIAAFESVPRHVFVPRVLVERDQSGGYEPLDGADPTHRGEWLKRVYADEPLPIHLDDGGAWISSSSQPSLMAEMLEALDLTGGERVLEVGTGTGYNAALLCAVLGDEKVTSVDIDPELVAQAERRLASLGYRPTLEVADGAGGHPAGAPYDRIIATCSLPEVPACWLAQVRDGGSILVNLYRELGGGALALLRVAGGQAAGRFLPFFGGFMPIRTRPLVRAVDLLEAHRDDDAVERPASIDAAVLRDDAFGMFAALRVDAQRLVVLPDDEPEQFWLLGRDGSWAYQISKDGKPVAVQGGPLRLWDALEDAHATWVRLGEPARERFGLTVAPDGKHTLWLDDPGSGHAWELPG